MRLPFFHLLRNKFQPIQTNNFQGLNNDESEESKQNSPQENIINPKRISLKKPKMKTGMSKFSYLFYKQ